eukprot:9535623-Karenia_brevis.AAC.1
MPMKACAGAISGSSASWALPVRYRTLTYLYGSALPTLTGDDDDDADDDDDEDEDDDDDDDEGDNPWPMPPQAETLA